MYFVVKRDERSSSSYHPCISFFFLFSSALLKSDNFPLFIRIESSTTSATPALPLLTANFRSFRLLLPSSSQNGPKAHTDDKCVCLRTSLFMIEVLEIAALSQPKGHLYAFVKGTVLNGPSDVALKYKQKFVGCWSITRFAFSYATVINSYVQLWKS